MGEEDKVDDTKFDVIKNEFEASEEFVYIDFDKIMKNYGKKGFNELGMIWTQMFYEFLKITKELMLESTGWGTKKDRSALFEHLRKHIVSRIGDYTIEVGGYTFESVCKDAKPLDMYDKDGKSLESVELMKKIKKKNKETFL